MDKEGSRERVMHRARAHEGVWVTRVLSLSRSTITRCILFDARSCCSAPRLGVSIQGTSNYGVRDRAGGGAPNGTEMIVRCVG